MGKMLGVDGPVFSFLSRIADIWILNLLWLLTSIPVFTIGASTTALTRAMMKSVLDQEGHVVSTYFSAFKSNFKQATIIWLIMAPIGLLLFFDLYFWSDVESTAGFIIGCLNIALMIPYCMILLYVFALQSFFDNPVRITFLNAILMAYKHFGQTLKIAVLFASVIILNSTIVLVNMITLTVGIGFISLITSVIYKKVFSNYVEKASESEEDFEAEI